MASFAGKVIAITGGASGIGLATSRLLASRGAKISIADLHPDVDSISKLISDGAGSPDVLAVKVDIRDVASVKSWIEQTVAKFGRLDGAANIAGVFKSSDDKTVADEDDKNWQFMLDVNLTGLMHTMREEIPHLNSGGSVVNAASILATRGWGGAAAYSASKHGVVGLTKSAAKEVGIKGIRVNCIAPGYIDTPMLASATSDADRTTSNDAGASAVPLGRMGQPHEVACLIAFLLSEEASFITGACISIDGGMSC